ncbi:MAG: outer membrane protein assembly factor BamA [Gammaproteobacteria bacterium]|nr:outer membrane protein assembly factor BamA [Gammaproteobacteria bacterium]
MSRALRVALVCLLLVGHVLPGARAQTGFTAEDIRVEGLQRISAGTVFNYLPIRIGDTVSEVETAEAIRALFKTGFFQDVRIEREGDTLVVLVTERPSVADIEFTGNENLETEQLLEALKLSGFDEGRVFNRSLFEETKQELREAYLAQGRYGVEIEATVTPLERNRVAVRFDIDEGRVARIQQINIVGNTAFEDDDLLDVFELSTPGFFTWFNQRDQYSRQRLGADLERLKSLYLDNGYINFSVDSTQVSITPNREDVYITINVTEGDQYLVRDIKLAGDLIVEPEELFPLVGMHEGEVFSRQQVSETTSQISERLGNEGYAFANVNAVPDIDEDAKEVNVTFFADPGKRVYVRRVIFKGNAKTQDEVLRREMRQIEGSWISTGALQRSRVRLQKLGYFESVEIETPAVPGSPDQVDVLVTVVERPSGSLIAGVGFSQSQGVVINASVTQENVLGSGKRVSATFNNSDANRAFGLGFFDPYYTLDGVSLGFDINYRETNASDANIADYSTDTLRGAVTLGFPINEFDRIRLSFAAQNTNFRAESDASTEVTDFERISGGTYNTYHLIGRWSRDSRNTRLLPDRGSLTSIQADLALPGSDLTFYTATFRHQQFLPLTKFLTFVLDAELGIGDGYGDTDDLPLTENFLAGGIRSIRGFDANTLGPRDSKGEPLGGNYKAVVRSELILPVPFIKDSRSFRLTGFVDAGNVFKDEVEVGEFRYSAGLSAIWISPFGVFTFSLAEPLNEQSVDELQRFQFTFGTSF